MDGKSFRILAAEPNEQLTELLRLTLRQHHIEVESAGSGTEALRRAEEESFDLFLIEAALPGPLDGYRLVEELRGLERTAMAPIVMVGEKAGPPERIRGLAAGADDYLTKPYDRRELIQRMRGLLRRVGQTLSANPLTRLPGNESIIQEITGRIRTREPLSVAYIDIDNFKAFNDKYGFDQGDNVIKFVADILRRCARPGDFVGHVGGDDFVVASQPVSMDVVLTAVTQVFESGVPVFYAPEDRQRGCIETQDRQGRPQKYPLMTLSIGVATNEVRDLGHYGMVVQVATEMKQYAKSHKNPGRCTIAKDQRKAL